MNEAKIRLSPKEMELVLNADWILTKNSILLKASQLLGRVLIHQQDHLLQADTVLPADVLRIPPKISKGDNYKGLPYLVLDYPRYFHHSGVFAIRTFFWWGNFFSVTLHLAGYYKQLFAPVLLKALPVLQQQEFYCCVHTDQWQHHFEEDNYLPAAAISDSFFIDTISNNSFIKLAKKIPLEKWDDAEDMLPAIYGQLISLLKKH
jgi:hypothetical protein